MIEKQAYVGHMTNRVNKEKESLETAVKTAFEQRVTRAIRDCAEGTPTKFEFKLDRNVSLPSCDFDEVKQELITEFEKFGWQLCLTKMGSTISVYVS